MDGHDMDDILKTCREAIELKGKPTIIVARTVKGRGVSYMEHDYNWHSKVMTDDDLTRAIADLERELEEA
jgi:transketolase